MKESLNRREARLSGYKGALREAESEVKEFLRRPPIEKSVVMGSEKGFTALPLNRRTLGMASEWWNKEINNLEIRKEEVDGEREALEEGLSAWRLCVDDISDFEDDLRRQMKSNASPGSDILKGQIEKMAQIIGFLEEKMHLAESKRWNLLICAVGAELAAFREGQEILKGALDMVESQNGLEQSREDTFYSTDDGTGQLKDSKLVTLNGRDEEQKGSSSLDDSEDDGPPDTLLVEEH